MTDGSENLLHSRTAIVTGGGRGIGRALSLALADAGANVVLAGRTDAQLIAVADEIARKGGAAIPCPTDVTDEAAVARLASTALEAYGRIDILVNNSGVVSSIPLLEQPSAEWDRVIGTNLRGVYLATRAVGQHLVEQGSGKVINIASNFAFMGIARHAAYCASKAAVVAFTRAMAAEWARYNVQVNALAPGYVATALNAELRSDETMMGRVLQAIPARRMGTVEELCPWLLLMASSASDFMTGETIVIDGGQTL